MFSIRSEVHLGKSIHLTWNRELLCFLLLWAHHDMRLWSLSHRSTGPRKSTSRQTWMLSLPCCGITSHSPRSHLLYPPLCSEAMAVRRHTTVSTLCALLCNFGQALFQYTIVHGVKWVLLFEEPFIKWPLQNNLFPYLTFVFELKLIAVEVSSLLQHRLGEKRGKLVTIPLITRHGGCQCLNVLLIYASSDAYLNFS